MAKGSIDDLISLISRFLTGLISRYSAIPKKGEPKIIPERLMLGLARRKVLMI